MVEELIPTRYREHISKELSYPIGAEKISQALQSIPQYGELALEFWSGWRATPSRLRQAATGGRFLRVLVGAWHQANPKRKRLNDSFTLSVYAVPRQFKRVATETLEAQGLGALRSWFMELNETCDLDTSKSMVMYVRVLDGELRVERGGRAA